MVYLPPLLKLGIVTLFLAPCISLAGLFLTSNTTSTKGLLLIGVALLLFGFGEVINHPLQTGRNYTEDDKSNLKQFKHRSRNPSSLGNLLVLSSLLFFFMGLAAFVSF